MEKDKGSIETNKAVCGRPAVPSNNAQGTNQNNNEGQPRVGKLFFINHEIEDVSLSSMSSNLTAYTETGIVENLSDYPVHVDYALTIAASTTTSVSSVTHHNDIVQKKFNSRNILTAFRRKASREVFPGSIPNDADWCNPAVNKSSDPTIDIENQPSREESSSAPDGVSVLSKSHDSLATFSDDGFGGYLGQNCSELNSRRNKLLIMTAFVLFLFGTSAVIAAVILDSKPDNREASNIQMTSFDESPIATTTSSSSTAPQTAFESPTTKTPTIDSDVLPQSTTTSSTTSIDESAEAVITYPSTTSNVNSSTTVATASSTASSSTQTTTASTTSDVTSSTTTALAVTTSESSFTTSAIDAPSKLSAIYLQAVANALMIPPFTNRRELQKEDNKEKDKNDNKGKDKEDDVVPVAEPVVAPIVANVEPVVVPIVVNAVPGVVDVVSFARFDISPMLNDPRGQPFKVLMHLKGNEEGGPGNISVDFLPRADLWDCSPCKQAQVDPTNSIEVGTFDDTYLDMSLAFSRGIYLNQMTFKIYSNVQLFSSDGSIVTSTALLDPELVLVWVEGNVDDFGDLTSLVEKISEEGS